MNSNKEKAYEELKFKEFIDGVCYELRKANAQLALHGYVYNALNDFTLPPGLGDYFNYSISAHYDSFMISIYNLVKHQNDTYNFPKIFNIMEGCPIINVRFGAVFIKEQRIIFNSNSNIIDYIIAVRDECLGHNIKNKDFSKLEKDINPEDFEALLKKLNSIICQISYKYDCTPIKFQVPQDAVVVDIFSRLGKTKKP